MATAEILMVSPALWPSVLSMLYPIGYEELHTFMQCLLEYDVRMKDLGKIIKFVAVWYFKPIYVMIWDGHCVIKPRQIYCSIISVVVFTMIKFSNAPISVS
jgi:hypothetical protein